MRCICVRKCSAASWTDAKTGKLRICTIIYDVQITNPQQHAERRRKSGTPFVGEDVDAAVREARAGLDQRYPHVVGERGAVAAPPQSDPRRRDRGPGLGAGLRIDETARPRVEDAAVPDGVKQAARRLIAAPLTTEVVTLGKGDTSLASDADAILGHARMIVAPPASA